MGSEWQHTTIGDQVRLQRGFDITKQTQRDGLIPVVSTAGVLSYHDTAMAKGPGVVIGRKGNGIGRAHFITEDYWPHDTTLWVTDFKGNDPRFVYYFFEMMFEKLQMLDVGSANPTLNRNHVHPIAIRWPPVREQQRIAHILGTLDDKIELNRRMNATLEAMARALFQSWFVDFDPVRAKMDGRKPEGLDDATAALFPSAFQESSAGRIPKGWTIVPVGDVVDCVGGGTPSTGEPKYWDGGEHHWTTPKDFSSLECPVLIDTQRKLTDAGIAKISSGLLPVGTVLLSSRAPVGYLAIAAMPVAINQGFIALKCNDRASNFFILNWCQTGMAEIKSRATGTTFPEISKQNFRPIPLVLPPRNLMAIFTARVAPLYAKLIVTVRQSCTLAVLRRALLPQLAGGSQMVRNSTLE